MKLRAPSYFIALLAVTVWCWVGGASPAPAAPYYQGKVLTILVGFPAGGGYDRVARLLAKHLPKHIPGNPSVIVENMPGGNGLIAANYLYNKVAPDGLTICTVNRSLPFAQMLKNEGVRFDITKFAWIGSAASESTVLAIRADLPYKTVQELLAAKEPLIVGSTGPADSGQQFVLLLSEATGLKTKFVIYTGSVDVMLALERGEVQARGGSYSSLVPFIQRGIVRVLVKDRAKDAGAAGLPVNEDLTTDPKWKKLMAIQAAPGQMGRPYFAPPKTPDDVMAILREAFASAAKDPELQADAKKVGMDIEYTTAAETMTMLNDMMDQPSDIMKELPKFVKF